MKNVPRMSVSRGTSKRVPMVFAAPSSTSGDVAALLKMQTAADALEKRLEHGSQIEDDTESSDAQRPSAAHTRESSTAKGQSQQRKTSLNGVVFDDEEEDSIVFMDPSTPSSHSPAPARPRRAEPAPQLSRGTAGGSLSHPKPLVRQGRTSTLSVAPSPASFRVASNCAEFGDDGTGFRTSSAKLAGWILFAWDVGNDPKFKRRYVEVDTGELRIFKTESPENYPARGNDHFDMSVSLRKGAASTLKVATGEGSSLFIEAPDVLVRELASRFWRLSGDEKPLPPSNMMNNVVLLPQRQDAILVWNGEIVSTVKKTLKTTMKLAGLNIQTAEHNDPLSGAAYHRLSVTNKEKVCGILTVPDPLLLMQWVGAINSSDAEPESRERPQRAVLAEALNNLVMEEAERDDDVSWNNPKTRARSATLGVGRVLGYTEADESVPSKAEIRREMIEKLPDHDPDANFPILKEMLKDPMWRPWVFKWSRAQHSSENVKFWVACENLCKMETTEDRADGLLNLAQSYIEADGITSVNIGGMSRKKILKQIYDAKAKGPEALAALLPGILDSPLAELARVMEFDIYPSLILLMKEALLEREVPSGPPVSSSPPRSPRGGGASSPAPVHLISSLMQDEEKLQDLLGKSTGKTQDCVSFLAVALQFSRVDAGKRSNIASTIMKTYFDAESSHCLEGTVDSKKIRLLERQHDMILMTPPHTISATFFDEMRIDVSAHLERFLSKAKGLSEGSKLTLGRNSSRGRPGVFPGLFARK